MNNNFGPQSQGRPPFPPRPQTGALVPPPGSQPLPPMTPPPFSGPPQQPQKPPSRRLDPWMVIALALSAILIVAGVILYFLQQNAPGLGITSNGGTTGTTPLPTPTPTLTVHQKDQQLAAQYVSKMSLEDMIGQLLVVTDDPTVTSDADLDYMVNTQHIGGVLSTVGRLDYDQANYADPGAQLTSELQRLTQEAKTPLFVASEDEGGYVRRLNVVDGTFNPPSAWTIGQSGDPTMATTQGTKMAQELKKYTFNTTFTPVSESCELENGYLDYNERCFARTPDEVVKYAGPYLAAIQQEGIIGTLKHFPGTGRIDQADDPHYTLPTVSGVSKDDYYNTDMASFKQLIQSQNALEHPGFIMSTYVLVPSIDPNYPAQYSHKFITDILRNQFGYDGVVITDSLTVMQGNQINGTALTLDQSVISALQAGDDMMLGITSSDQIDLITSKIKDAIQQGTLTQDRIKESAIRVITLKLERNLMSEASVQS